MKTLTLILLMSTLVAGVAHPATPAYTVTFDDVPIGANLSYYSQQYGLAMSYGWQVVNGAAAGWTPYSGSQVAVWNSVSSNPTAFGLGFDGGDEYTARSVGAYFSTQPGTVLSMVAYGWGFTVIATASIGSATEAWTNRYVGITSGNIYAVGITGVSSDDARYHFAMDNLSVVPRGAPEPSSLLALLAGLGSVGGVMLRRRRGI